ncbi:DUF4345 domain-containing protein [Planctobacterium marinum]|uniref:DUF4345 domain-containing protein n=1 Tax=Planctobacterium marinum TaxID=1631968 RepID=A0AA48HTY2_9ALTE|nr:hypothetical protein MACH26_13090 [Planctobacterium marinum]
MAINKRKTYLFFAGFVLLLVGFYIGLMPVDYLNQFFNNSQFSTEALSEMRGMGGTIFVFGFFILAGAFFKQIEYTSIIIAALIFASFSVFRLIGIIIDGIPAQSIFVALTIELLFAFSVIPFLLRKDSRAPSESH